MTASPIIFFCLTMTPPSFLSSKLKIQPEHPYLNLTHVFIVTSVTSPQDLSSSTSFLSTLLGGYVHTSPLALMICFFLHTHGQVLRLTRAQCKCHLLNKAFFEPPAFSCRWTSLSFL